MATYNIYGIGAALVDTEVEVSDAFLASAQIDKGVMTLVDELRQTELLKALASENTQILRKCGGSVCNSVVAASSLGAKVFFSGKVADDSDGADSLCTGHCRGDTNSSTDDPRPGCAGYQHTHQLARRDAPGC